MTTSNLEEIQYKELTDKVVDYIIHAHEGTNITITRLRDLAQKQGKYPGVGYCLNIVLPTPNNDRISYRYKYVEDSYVKLYYRLIGNVVVNHFLQPDMSPEEVELQLAIRGY